MALPRKDGGRATDGEKEGSQRRTPVFVKTRANFHGLVTERYMTLLGCRPQEATLPVTTPQMCGGPFLFSATSAAEICACEDPVFCSLPQASKQPSRDFNLVAATAVAWRCVACNQVEAYITQRNI